MPEHNLFIVKADDWRGLYDNGKLVREGHRLFPEDVLDYLGIDVSSGWADKYLQDRGGCPEDLKDVEFD